MFTTTIRSFRIPDTTDTRKRQAAQSNAKPKGEAPKIQAIKDNASLTGMQKLAPIKALHEQTEPQVKAILSQQQFGQLQEIRRQEIEKMIEKKRAAQ